MTNDDSATDDEQEAAQAKAKREAEKADGRRRYRMSLEEVRARVVAERKALGLDATVTDPAQLARIRALIVPTSAPTSSGRPPAQD